MAYSQEILVLLRIVTAHLLADFLMQPERWIEQKALKNIKSPALYYHALVVGIMTYLLLGDWDHAGLPLFIMGTHFLIDWWKSSRPRRTAYFVIDQTAHLLMILVGWAFYSNTIGTSLGFIASALETPVFWIVVMSYLIVIWPFGYLIAMLTSRWQNELSKGDSEQLTGLKNAGMWIGRTERFIILTFILLSQYSAIGFLIAAKSVFRFSGKLEGNRERKEAEYILIGTLLSFALSISAGIGAKYLLNIFG